MAVIELTTVFKDPFFIFAKNFEYKSISFISRLYQNGRLSIPSSKTAKIFCEISDSNPMIILNAIMITSGGIVLPIFSDSPPSPLIIHKMMEKVVEYKKKLFCILGVSEDTEGIKKTLTYTDYFTINYSLLKKNLNTQYSIERTLLKIKKAKKRDALLLFPLEKEYLLEEVLIGNSELNQEAALLNLKKTCANQSVFYASSKKTIIAKVNTNGRGFGCDQIGGVYTKPEYRKQGISTYLMKILLNEIHMSGKNAVLYVKKDNIPALTLYKNMGFYILSNYSAHYIKN